MSAKKRILIVDDDDFVLSLLEEALNSSVYETVSCKNGVEALAHIETTHFEAVITDVSMPGKDGLELAKELRGKQENLPILMISGEDYRGADKANYLNSICQYADEVLGKPFSKEDVLSTLQNIIENPRANIGTQPNQRKTV